MVGGLLKEALHETVHTVGVPEAELDKVITRMLHLDQIERTPA